MTPCIVYLTCADREEAEKISDALLDKHLIACAKRFLIDSSNWWQGKRENASEVYIMMDTIEEKFDEIEREVRKLHSYETFVLTSFRISKMSHGVQEWLEAEIE